MYLQRVQADISPPIAAVFLIGILWKRVNAQGANAALATGFVLGMTRLVLDLNNSSLPEGWVLSLVTMNFLHFAIVLFVVCVAVLVGVSLLCPAETDSKLKGLTSSPRERDGSRTTMHRQNVRLTGVLILAVVAVWLYFRG